MRYRRRRKPLRPPRLIKNRRPEAAGPPARTSFASAGYCPSRRVPFFPLAGPLPQTSAVRPERRRAYNAFGGIAPRFEPCNHSAWVVQPTMRWVVSSRAGGLLRLCYSTTRQAQLSTWQSCCLPADQIGRCREALSAFQLKRAMTKSVRSVVPRRKPLPRSLLLILAVLALGMTAGGSFFLRVQLDALLRQEGETLGSIAVLKVSQVSRWRGNRLAEANAIAANSLFNEQLRTILESQAGSSADQVREWMQALLPADNEYTRVELVAAGGTVRVSVPPASLPLSPSDRALIDEAFRVRQAMMSDFHVDDPAEGPSPGVAVQLLVGRSATRGSAGRAPQRGQAIGSSDPTRLLET